MSVRSTEACWVVWIGAPDEMRIQITVPMSDTQKGRVNPRMHVTRTQPVTCVQRCSAGMLATELTTACGGPLLGGRQPSCNYTWVCSDSTTGPPGGPRSIVTGTYVYANKADSGQCRGRIYALHRAAYMHRDHVKYN